MNLEEALAYLTPHSMTGDGACIGLTAGKMREAVRVIRDEIKGAQRWREVAEEVTQSFRRENDELRELLNESA